MTCDAARTKTPLPSPLSQLSCLHPSLALPVLPPALLCRTGRASFLILLLGGVIGVSGMLLGTLSLLGLYGDMEGVNGQAFTSICAARL